MARNYEWRVYLRKGEKVFRGFKIVQNSNLDITIMPKKAVYLPAELTENLMPGEPIKVVHEGLSKEVDHYSLHVATGQRHMKLRSLGPAEEPSIEVPIKEVNKPIPLVALVAVADTFSEEAKTKGQFFGYVLPDDVNYAIFELIAIPKKTTLNVAQQGIILSNERPSMERFDIAYIEMRNCTIAVRYHSTNHEPTDISTNVVFRLSEGKSVHINRAEKGSLIGVVNSVVIGESRNKVK